MARSNNSSRKRTQRDYTLVFKLGVITTRFSQGFFPYVILRIWYLLIS